jgi:hypothetical protein
MTSGTSKEERRPSKYSASCVLAATNGCSASSQPAWTLIAVRPLHVEAAERVAVADQQQLADRAIELRVEKGGGGKQRSLLR